MSSFPPLRNPFRAPRKPRRPGRGRFRPALDPLEDRTLPSITVTTASDAVAHTGTSLRDAIAAAAGRGDTIVFDPSLAGATITLAQGQLELIGAGGGPITIDASSLSRPVTVSGNLNSASRVFQVDSGAQAIFNDLVITNGYSEGYPGNTGNGGGINNAGILTVTNSTLSRNTASHGFGGGIYNTGTLTVANCTLSGNTGTGTGIYNKGTLTVSNSTLAGNSPSTGAAIFNQGTLTVADSTIAGNFGGGGAGGVYNDDINGGKLTLVNSIVAGNSGGDVGGTATGHNNLIGNGSGMTGLRGGDAGHNQVGTSTSPIDPMLGPLQNNGGPTATMALQPNSPAHAAGGAVTTITQDAGTGDQTVRVANAAAIACTPGQYLIRVDGEEMEVTAVDTGNNSLTVTRGVNGVRAAPRANDPVFFFADQRGVARDRLRDLGSYEDASGPPPAVSTISTTSGPTGGNTVVTLTGSNLGTARMAAVYFGTEPGIITRDDGSTLVVISPSNTAGAVDVTVTTTGGTATSPQPFTYFPGPITVTTNSDTAVHTGTSLRDALVLANQAAADGISDTIVFDPGLAGATITLAQGQLELSGAGAGTITIDAGGFIDPHASLLSDRLVTIDANGAGRALLIDAGVQAGLRGLKVTGGNITLLDFKRLTPDGAGIYNRGNLFLFSCSVTNNSVSNVGPTGSGPSEGGGLSNAGTLLVYGSVVADNSAGTGGGVYNSGTLLLANCFLNHNTAGDRGGGGLANAGTALVVNSTIQANLASGTAPGFGLGGGILGGSGTLTVVDSTVFFNDAQGSVPLNFPVVEPGAGGIQGDVTLLNSIVNANLNAGMTAGKDFQGTLFAGSGHNLITVPDDGLAGFAADNGGPTPTIALRPGSPALGAGGPVAGLAAAVSATDTTLPFPSAWAVVGGRFIPPYVIGIDNEQILITGVVSGGTVTVVRGYRGTAPAAHAAGAPIYLTIDQRGEPRPASGLQDIGAFEGVLGPAPASLPRVAGALSHSDESYANFITAAYQKYLGRPPDAAGLAAWVAAMRGGLSDERLEAGFIGSGEYIANHGGQGAGWVRGMYLDLLGRTTVSDAEVQAWVNALNAGVSTTAVAYGFAASDEREGQRIAADYEKYLGRDPEPGVVAAAWLPYFHRGGSNEDIVAAFAGSGEYFRNHGYNLADWLDGAFRAILGRAPDAAAFQAWMAVLVGG